MQFSNCHIPKYISMNERSLHLSPAGIETVNLALANKNMTPERLALELKLASLYVNKFFRGEAIATQMFAQICEGLGLNWQELFNKSASPAPSLSIDNTVQEARQKCHESLTKSCNRIRILDMREPRELKEIYTNLNIIEESSGQSRERLNLRHDRSSILTKIGDRLKRDANSEELDRYLSQVTTKSVPAIQAIKEYSKLIILGGVGVGKTTFLKYLVLQCLNANFHGELVPVLISLKDFAESTLGLNDYLILAFTGYGIRDTNAIEHLLNQGNLLILLDGLDEVEKSKIGRVIVEMKALADRFHRNHIFITCRSYDYKFEQFSEVHIAKFNDDQIHTFIRQWFNNKEIVKNFTKAIAQNSAFKELTETPLLLTFLCLIFESNSSLNYLETVEQCLEIQISTWDRDRDINSRDLHHSINSDLNLKSGFDLGLDLWSHIALISLDTGKYVFKSKHLSTYAKSYFKTYFKQRSHNLSFDPIVELDMKALLKSGLLIQKYKDTYAFAYIAFQEYLAAKRIAESPNPHAVDYLVDRLEHEQWQNVILLASGLMVNADNLVLKLYKKINQILEKQQNIQEFLDWIGKNSTYLRVSYQPTTLRAFYLDISLNNFRIQDRNRALEITRNRAIDRIKERTGDNTAAAIRSMDRNTAIGDTALSETAINADLDLAMALNLDLAIYIANEPVLQLAELLEPQLKRSLQTLKEQLPNPQTEVEKFKSWWHSSGIAWSKDCRSLLIQHRKGTQDWSFTDEEEALLKRYHDAHILLVNCFNTSSISAHVKQNILENMFLPIWQQS